MNNQVKSRKRAFGKGKSDDKSGVAVVKTVPQVGCLSPRLRAVRIPKRMKYRGNRGEKFWDQFDWFDSHSLRYVKQVSEKNIGQSLGQIQVKIPPYAVKFEDRSQEENERQVRCARGKAWNLARNIYKLKEKDKATFYSPTEEWIMPAASTIKPKEREFVVDSGASMHMVSKRDLNSAELETTRIWKKPTTVMTANGEVQTREEATVYVKELDLFVTVMVLEETPTVLHLGS